MSPIRSGHQRRPAFPMTMRVPSDQLVCDARSYVRAYRADGRALHAPMLAWTVGPLAIGETGDNSLESLISGRWLVQVCPDGSWVLYQEEGGLLTVTPWDDPPTFAGEDARHPTATFDQAARAVLAWEELGTIQIRRWDPFTSQYVENVSFTGHDPSIALDATWSYFIPDSDVLLFYLSADRERVMCRVQREVFAIEHELYDHGAPLVLDRVLRLPLQYMVLVSDEHGSPLVDENGDRIVLLSDRYPYRAADPAQLSATALDGDYRQVAIVVEPAPEQGLLSGTALDGAYEPVVIFGHPPPEAIVLAATAEDGSYAPVVIFSTPPPEELELSATAVDGEYDLTYFETHESPEGMSLGARALDGTYEPA